MGILEWGLLGALFLGIMIFCAKIMKKGLTTLDDDRKKYMERIHEGERRIAEDRKNISAQDHLSILHCALDDLLRLGAYPPAYSTKRDGMAIELLTPDGAWRVELAMRERSLKSSSKVLHGKSRWILSGFGQMEQYWDVGPLMASLNSHLRAEPLAAEEPEHLARRMGGFAAVAHKM